MNEGNRIPLRDRQYRKTVDFAGTDSRTKQSFRDGTRVDHILKQYATKGVDPNDIGLFASSVARQPFGVQDMARDYQNQLNLVNRTNAYFAALPSGVRDFFRNEPGNMVNFMADPKNKAKCVELGLFAPPPEGSARKDKPAEAGKAPEGAGKAP